MFLTHTWVHVRRWWYTCAKYSNLDSQLHLQHLFKKHEYQHMMSCIQIVSLEILL